MFPCMSMFALKYQRFLFKMCFCSVENFGQSEIERECVPLIFALVLKLIQRLLLPTTEILESRQY